MTYILTFIISFIVIYLVYFLVVINRKKGIEKFKEGKQIEYFKTVYSLDTKKIDIKKFASELAMINAFIMSTTLTVLELIDSLILKMIIGFILIIPLMLITYKILGTKYQKKEGK